MEFKFIASLPPIQSALKIGQDGMRLQLDVSEMELHKAVNLVSCRGENLEVTIKVLPRDN